MPGVLTVIELATVTWSSAIAVVAVCTMGEYEGGACK